MSAEGTLDLFERWSPVLSSEWRLPLALVLQNGQERLPVPWRKIAAVFLGGDTRWKLGPEAAELVAEARRRGKHVHGGRVNSARRVAYMASIGCHSVDGTGASKWRDKRPALLAPRARAPRRGHCDRITARVDARAPVRGARPSPPRTPGGTLEPGSGPTSQ